MYQDVIKKIEFQKERIVKDFIRNGVCPSPKIIEEKVAQIDNYLSIFKHYNKVSGEHFDVDEYNAGLMAVYNDLRILYELLIDTLEKEYATQQNYINSHLMQLESLARMYYNQALYESSSTTLGKSLLFLNSGFTIETEDSATFIDLGEVAIKECSKVACLANINNCDHDNIIFEFKNKETGEFLQTAAYNKYGEALKFPGKKTMNNYKIQLEEGQKVDESILMNIGAEIDVENSYSILAGKNSIQFNSEILKVPSQLTEHRFFEKGHINFYVVGGNSASFKFNQKPLSANFILDEDRVKGLDYIHHFFIEAPEDFQFSVEIDTGEIYATHEKGIVNEDKLFYIGNTNVKDFFVIEEKEGIKGLWSSRLKIVDNEEDTLEIESIVMKEVDA